MISFIFAPKSTENFGSASADAGRKRMIMDEKKALRKEIRQLKQACPPEEKFRKSASVWEKVEGMPIFREAKTVLAYWSMDDEVYTHDFVKKWAGQKTFLLPCVRGDELELRYFDGEEKLAPGEGYAIPEPVGELFTDWAQIDLILVPGVAFDRAGNRLGRGKRTRSDLCGGDRRLLPDGGRGRLGLHSGRRGGERLSARRRTETLNADKTGRAYRPVFLLYFSF